MHARHFAVVLLLLATIPGCARMSQALQSALPNRAQHAKTQYSVARLQEKQGNLVEARKSYEELLEQNPDHVDARHRLAVICSRLGELEVADQYFQEALDRDPANGQVWCDLGYALYMHNDPTGAEQALRQSLVCEPGDKRTLNNLALVLGQQDRFEESLAMFRRSGTEAEAHANLAFIYAQAGQGQKAIDHYSKALDLDEDLDVAKAGLVQLAAMKAELEPQQASDRALIARTAEMMRRMGPPADMATASQRRANHGDPFQQPLVRDDRNSGIAPAGGLAARSDDSPNHHDNAVRPAAWTKNESDTNASQSQLPRQGATTWDNAGSRFGAVVEPQEVQPQEVLPDDHQMFQTN